MSDKTKDTQANVGETQPYSHIESAEFSYQNNYGTGSTPNQIEEPEIDTAALVTEIVQALDK